MRLFCSMIHFASGVFLAWVFLRIAWGFLQVRRKPVRLCHPNFCVFQGTLSKKAPYDQNCVSPELNNPAFEKFTMEILACF